MKKPNFKRVVEQVTAPNTKSQQVQVIENITKALVQAIRQNQQRTAQGQAEHLQQLTKNKEELSQLQSALEALKKGDLETVLQHFPYNRVEIEQAFPGSLKPLPPFRFTSGGMGIGTIYNPGSTHTLTLNSSTGLNNQTV